jgi:hypothetical protein
VVGSVTVTVALAKLPVPTELLPLTPYVVVAVGETTPELELELKPEFVHK